MPVTLITILRSFLAFFLLLLLTRIKGKTQLSQMTYFDYATGITIGAIAATLSVSTSLPIISVTAGLVVWVLLGYLSNLLALNSIPARKLLEGEPTIVIRNGKVMEEAMARARYNLDELMMQLRERKIYDLSKVQEGVLEVNGKLSVLTKPEDSSATKKDLNISTAKVDAEPVILVVDGNIARHRLQALGFSEDWLQEQIHNRGIDNIHNVMVAVLETSGNIYIDARQDWEAQTNLAG